MGSIARGFFNGEMSLGKRVRGWDGWKMISSLLVSEGDVGDFVLVNTGGSVSWMG
jgi:hypothetical protein